MDVEGYEYNIIVGNKEFVENYKPEMFFIEIHVEKLTDQKIVDILNVFDDNNYMIRRAYIEDKYYSLNKVRSRLAKLLYYRWLKNIGQIASHISIKEFCQSYQFKQALKSRHSIELMLEKD